LREVSILKILKNRTVLGLACIILSLAVCFILVPIFNSAAQSQVGIVRVTRDIKKGEMITANMITKVNVGGYNLPGDVIKETERVVGKYAAFDLLIGDYVLPRRLSDSPLTDFVYLQELEGRRAISVSIKSFAAGLSGKLEAGDIISLVSVGGTSATTPRELQYVRVLAVTDRRGYDKGQLRDARDGDERSLPATVTLAVNKKQAEKLAWLEEKGTLHFVLVYRGNYENANELLRKQDDFFTSLESGAEELYDSTPQEEEINDELQGGQDNE
jgi:pilus assembly protein CpaB